MAEHHEQDISLMPVAGWSALLVGLAVHAWGWFFDTTVASGASAYAYVGDRTHNIGLIATHISIVVTGGMLALLGVVILVAYGIRKEIRLSRRALGLSPANDHRGETKAT